MKRSQTESQVLSRYANKITIKAFDNKMRYSDA